MREPTALVVRPNSSVARVARFRSRMQRSDERLRAALERFRAAAHGVTPAARISESPVSWVVGAFAVGVFIGWLSRSPKNRRLM
jgi:hypothetical protein